MSPQGAPGGSVHQSLSGPWGWGTWGQGGRGAGSGDSIAFSVGKLTRPWPSGSLSWSDVPTPKGGWFNPRSGRKWEAAD